MADIQTVIDTLQDAKVNDLGHIWITDEARCAMVRILMKSAELLKEQQNQIESFTQIDDALAERIIDMQDNQPQHKTGKWTNHELVPDFERNIVIASYECSECGMKCGATTPFCPFCGADMRIIQS